MGRHHKSKNNNKSSSNKNANASAGATAAAHTQPTQQQPQKPHQTHAKLPTLTLQKRNQLDAVVKRLLEFGIMQPKNANEEWEQYVDMQSLLQQVLVLEAPLRRTVNKQTRETRLANIEAFYRWANENGLHYDGLSIAEFVGYDLGLKATRDIAEDELLFTIPRKLILSEENLEKGGNELNFGSMSNLKLTYALMLETLKPESFWRPYIDLLPSQYYTVLYYTTKEMELLRGSTALTTALRQCRAIARQYAFLYNCTVNAPAVDKISPLGLLFQEQFSYDLYRWSVSTVMTRQNLIPRSQPAAASSQSQSQSEPELIAALIPFWDMANHREGRVTSFYSMASRQMESNAQTSFKTNEQIFIHYGDRPNADLMIHNGFINPTNSKDYVCIKLGLGTSDPLQTQRAKLLELLHLPKNSELKVLPAPKYISPELLAFVRVFNMNDAQLEHWITSERAMDLLHIDCALETALECKTWMYLQTRLMLLLRVFPTTLEEDEAQLAAHKNGTEPKSYVKAMLLEYRVLEKRILAAALDYAKQRAKA